MSVGFWELQVVLGSTAVNQVGVAHYDESDTLVLSEKKVFIPANDTKEPAVWRASGNVTIERRAAQASGVALPRTAAQAPKPAMPQRTFQPAPPAAIRPTRCGWAGLRA